MRHFIWLWTVIARKKDQCHRLTLSQCRRRGPAWRSARGRGCWAGPGRWCPSSPGCPHTGGGRTHSATSWPASPWPSCTYHRCGHIRLVISKDDTMVGFWGKSQKSDQMPYFGQNFLGCSGLWRNLEEFSRNSEIYPHDNVWYLHIYFEYCCFWPCAATNFSQSTG